ncbi:MAG: alpha-L-rhamnosidase N-terminal domain-containing protein [Verrucomicrobia bacterium]|nr:alpha-L-rhamnosidase N-terminal domain-containing protein [Verrucomicrobiota bacterium]
MRCWLLSADNYCDAAINGTAIGHGAHWERTARLDATKALKPGANAVTLTAGHTDLQMPGVTGRLVIQFEFGDDMIVPTDNTWKASQEPAAGCDKPGFDDSAWPVSQEGGSPTGGGPPLADLARIPAPYLRKSFTVDTPVKRAMVYVTALGTYELHLNGKRVSKDVFAPGWTEFRKRVHYQTYDVTASWRAELAERTPFFRPSRIRGVEASHHAPDLPRNHACGHVPAAQGLAICPTVSCTIRVGWAHR